MKQGLFQIDICPAQWMMIIDRDAKKKLVEQHCVELLLFRYENFVYYRNPTLEISIISAKYPTRN